MIRNNNSTYQPTCLTASHPYCVWRKTTAPTLPPKSTNKITMKLKRENNISHHSVYKVTKSIPPSVCENLTPNNRKNICITFRACIRTCRQRRNTRDR